MRYSNFLALALFACLVRTISAATPEELVDALMRTVGTPKGNTRGDEHEAVLEAGAPTIPYLLPLLRDDDQRIRFKASWVLSEMKGLTDEHLDVLIDANQGGDMFICSAIARVGSPRAAKYLVGKMLPRGDISGIQWVFPILGERAVPAMLERYRTDEGWDENLEEGIASAFGTLRRKGRSAIDPLLEIAKDERLPTKRRTRAIAALGAIGSSNAGEIETLHGLAERGDASIRNAVMAAVPSIRAGDAMDTWLHLRQLAIKGPEGVAAGPEILKHLSDDDWDVRVAATRALGYVGFADATDDLIQTLRRVEDWRLVFSAAESLGLETKNVQSPIGA